ncbi:hypothetical protein B7494_g2937 [Chlorociboria aeruginascens]|nr:hypothetical protein B7494_g2937 [Chlorociboria aeruginascens]
MAAFHDLESDQEKSTESTTPEESLHNAPVKPPSIEARSKIVQFDSPDDPAAPLNWPISRKIIITVLYGLTTAGSTWASSVYSPATAVVGCFNIVRFGVGPLLWAPLSEVYGRRIAVFAPYFIAAIFCFATATAKDIQTIMITRFFIGFFSSAPVTNTGGVLRDLWPDKQRGVAVLAYSMSVVGGPLFSPIAGAAIVQSYLGWRWTHYITGIMMMSCLVVDILVIDETYAKVILVSKAKKLRDETGDWALHAKHEEDINFRNLAKKFLFTPFRLLVTPICFFIVLYSSFVYGIVYLNFAAFPIEYVEVRKWGPVSASLPFIA